jgi:antitoxin component of MazEF toxin-antitoxin module
MNTPPRRSPSSSKKGFHPEADIKQAPTRREYTLEELVRNITSDNRHEEMDFGPPVGREIL